MIRLVSKLVRDKLPELDPGMVVTPAPESERAEWLKAKLIEEAVEVDCASPEDLLEELGDVWEVFKSIVLESSFDMSQVLEAARQKRAERGGFDKLLLWDDE